MKDDDDDETNEANDSIDWPKVTHIFMLTARTKKRKNYVQRVDPVSRYNDIICIEYEIIRYMILISRPTHYITVSSYRYRLNVWQRFDNSPAVHWATNSSPDDQSLRWYLVLHCLSHHVQLTHSDTDCIPLRKIDMFEK